MIEHDLEIRTPAGQMNSFVAHPDEGGPFPVVFFYMDAPGKREELHDMARRIATTGYVVVLPNLYYRKTREFVWDQSDGAMKSMFEMTKHLSLECIMEDTKAMLDFVDNFPLADTTRVGAVGYCMSGPFVFKAAGRYPERIACAASIYGANLLTQRDDSPHLDAHKIRGEIYFACAEIDHYAPKDVVDSLEAHLATCDINYRLEWYPGAEHGFAFPGRGKIFHKASAERHWNRLHSLFDRNLKGPIE